MKILNQILTTLATTALTSVAFGMPGESCYLVNGGFSSEALQSLGPPQQPSVICTEPANESGQAVIALYDWKLMSRLGAFEAKLGAQLELSTWASRAPWTRLLSIERTSIV